MMFMRIAVLAALALAMSAAAQDSGPGRARGGRFEPDRASSPGEPRILGAMAGPPGPVVRGAPYSASMITEITQLLPDGNRIRQTSTARVFRDSDGRVRSEVRLTGLGALGPALDYAGHSQMVIFIWDPVSGVDYVINPRERTFTKTVRERGGRPDRRKQGGPPREWGGRSRRNDQNFKAEFIGRQSFEGLAADGSRTTMTIPAGQIGNEQPIQIVSERWYSPDLQTVMFSRHMDPRVGETVTKLVKVNRNDPPHWLFEPPPDFKPAEANRDARSQDHGK